MKRVRLKLLTTTALRLLPATALSANFAFVMPAIAADLSLPYPPAGQMPLANGTSQMPAVDGVNGAVSLYGGGGDPGGLFGASGILSMPLGNAFGSQTEGTIASLDGNLYLSLGQHLFWRDPAKGLLGFYGSVQHYDANGGTTVGHAGGEAEAYLGRFTLRGVAGAEFGDKNLGTNFFDMVDVVYYPTDNFDLYAGHRYIGGNHALALGTEYLFHSDRPTAMGLFAEGHVGEHASSVWAGLRIHFGNSGKTLIRRNREDDPNVWEPDTLLGIAGGLGTPPVANNGESG